MTKREILLKTVRREGMYGPACDIALSPPKLKEYQNIHPAKEVEDYFDLYHRYAAAQLLPGYKGSGCSLFNLAAFPAGRLPDNFTVDPFGVGMARGSKAAFHMVHFHSPLRGKETTHQDIIDFPLPLVSADAESKMKAFVTETRNNGYASIARLEQTIWERAWLLRGMEDLMADMFTQDSKARLMLDKMTDHACCLGKLYAEAGFDIIMLGDDIGMQHTIMMGLPMWRQWLKPRLGKVIDTIRKYKPDVLILYHSCGFIEPFIPELIAVGVDILNPIQPESMDTADIYHKYSDRLSFWGGIGTQTTLPFGTPDEVKKRVFELTEMAIPRGGIVIGPTHIVEPEVPWQNLEAFRSAVLEARLKTQEQ